MPIAGALATRTPRQPFTPAPVENGNHKFVVNPTTSPTNAILVQNFKQNLILERFIRVEEILVKSNCIWHQTATLANDEICQKSIICTCDFVSLASSHDIHHFTLNWTRGNCWLTFLFPYLISTSQYQYGKHFLIRELGHQRYNIENVGIHGK